MAARIRSNLPCERGKGKTPQAEKASKPSAGLGCAAIDFIVFVFLHPVLILQAVKLRRGAGRAREESGIDMKSSLLQAVYINLGCCNGELLLLFNCLEANGSAGQTWTLKTSIFCHRPTANNSDRMSEARFEVSTSFRSSTWRRSPREWRTTHKLITQNRTQKLAKTAAETFRKWRS